MVNVVILLADGFEEAEALVPADLLKRAGADVRLVSIDGLDMVTGSHQFRIGADCSIDQVNREQLSCVILPGGKHGTSLLDCNVRVHSLIQSAVARGIYIAAICAAPSVLGHMGLLDGRRFTCYPGFETEIPNGIHSENRVERDDIFITAEGMGVSDEFGFTLIRLLFGEEKEMEIRTQVRHS